jgi:hypothetical protein
VKHRIVARVYDRRGTLIAQATNSYEKTHPIQAHFAKLCGKPDSIYLHAEVAALLKCGLKRPYSMLHGRLTNMLGFTLVLIFTIAILSGWLLFLSISVNDLNKRLQKLTKSLDNEIHGKYWENRKRIYALENHFDLFYKDSHTVGAKYYPMGDER